MLAYSAEATRDSVNATSCAVSGVPSEKTTSSRTRSVSDIPLSATVQEDTMLGTTSEVSGSLASSGVHMVRAIRSPTGS